VIGPRRREKDSNVKEQDEDIIHHGANAEANADADRVVESEREAIDALRYSYNYLMETGTRAQCIGTSEGSTFSVIS
jgi:hypothetical protein